MADRGQIEGALIDGPLTFDNAIGKYAALIKGVHSPAAGEADILPIPDLRGWPHAGHIDMAGIVLGAPDPYYSNQPGGFS